MSYQRLFVVSDIHGHYTQLKEALDAAGFDEKNGAHLLICCGDLFDRGRENRRVYDYVRGLEHKVLVRGNHDQRLREILTQKRADVYDLYNGAEVTLEEFFGPGCVNEYGDLRLPKHGKMAGKLCRLIDGMADYFETKHYVFVHGWIPTLPGKKEALADWRNADAVAWRSSRHLEWMSLYGSPAMLPDKTIVCGHRPTRLGCQVDPKRSPTDTGIFYGQGMIAIDAGTIRSGHVNVLVLEEEVKSIPEVKI